MQLPIRRLPAARAQAAVRVTKKFSFLFLVNCSELSIDSALQLVQQGCIDEASRHLGSGETQVLS